MTTGATEMQHRYGSLFHEYVCLVQKYAEQSNIVHLVLSPIGTNMLMLASELSINTKLGRRTCIAPGVYSFDRRTLQQYNRRYGTNHQVLPWVLQRYDEYYSHPDPWTIWFQDLSENEFRCANPVSRLEELEAELARLRPSLDEPHILEAGICAAYVGRLNNNSRKLVARHEYVGEERCVAVHIRRGDASDESLTSKDPNRAHFHLNRYAREMEAYVQAGFRQFYVMSESQMEIDRLVDQFQGKCRISFQEIDRSRFPNLLGKEHGFSNFIEYLCLDDPELTQYSMETALVDLYNASRCQAMLGTFESAFSSLAFLQAVGLHNEITPHLDLSGGEMPFIYPNLIEGSASLFVIKERDVGFFSLFLQVVNTLLYLKKEDRNAIPYVSFTGRQGYHTGGETWSEVFEPLAWMHEAYIAGLLRRANRDFEARAPGASLWDSLGLVYVVGDDLAWSGSYYPTRRVTRTRPGPWRPPIRRARRLAVRILKRTPFTTRLFERWKVRHLRSLAAASRETRKGHISHELLPNGADRKKASLVIGKFINLKPRLRAAVEELFEGFADHYILGVQFRGTDARMDKRRTIPSYEAYLGAVTQHLDSRGIAKVGKVAIFVASDESAFVEFMSDQYDNVLSFDSPRHVAASAVRAKGPMGGSIPTFVGLDQKGALEGAVLDYAALCKTDFMIHNFGSLSNAVLLTRPDLGNELIGLDYEQSGRGGSSEAARA